MLRSVGVKSVRELFSTNGSVSGLLECVYRLSFSLVIWLTTFRKISLVL